MTRHIVIPDTQVKPGVPLDHLSWIGEYIADKRPDTVVHLGDHYDMPSLSSYDVGKKSFEGRRYVDDIAEGNLAFELLTKPIKRAAAKAHKKGPRLIYLLGNHEQRIERATENDAKLDGAIGYHDFVHTGWERHDFLKIVWVDGIAYSHYFAQPLSGRPYGGQSIDTRLKSIGHSFTMGHQQVFMLGRRETGAGAHHGLVAGNCYLHDEVYRGPQANNEWRGIIVKNEVENGAYDVMAVSLNYLCKRFENMPLANFLAKKYPNMNLSLKNGL